MRHIVAKYNSVTLISCGIATLALVFLTVEQVIARYFFGASSIAAQELLWHIFSYVFLISASATLASDKHVRVDIFYSKLGSSGRAAVDILGALFFLIPSMAVLIWFGYQDVLQARDFSSVMTNSSEQVFSLLDFLLQGERSPDPGGLPARWIVKSLLPISAFMVMLQGLISISENFLIFIHKKENT